MVTAAATTADTTTPSRATTTGAEPGPPRLRLLRYEPDAEGPARPRSVTAPAHRPNLVVVDLADSSDLRRRIAWVLRLALEVLDGRRPLAQLAPHLAPSAVRYMRAAVACRPPVREPSRMTSLHVGRPDVGIAEVAVVYRRGSRARALAARFEHGHPRRPSQQVTAVRADLSDWRCVSLRLL